MSVAFGVHSTHTSEGRGLLYMHMCAGRFGTTSNSNCEVYVFTSSCVRWRDQSKFVEVCSNKTLGFLAQEGIFLLQKEGYNTRMHVLHSTWDITLGGGPHLDTMLSY